MQSTLHRDEVINVTFPWSSSKHWERLSRHRSRQKHFTKQKNWYSKDLARLIHPCLWQWKYQLRKSSRNATKETYKLSCLGSPHDALVQAWAALLVLQCRHCSVWASVADTFCWNRVKRWVGSDILKPGGSCWLAFHMVSRILFLLAVSPLFFWIWWLIPNRNEF